MDKKRAKQRTRESEGERTLVRPLFDLGRVVATRGATDALTRNSEKPAKFLDRHIQGDWGDIDDNDKPQNEKAVHQGGRILSAYHLADETKIWIATESDRSVTTIMLPAED